MIPNICQKELYELHRIVNCCIGKFIAQICLDPQKHILRSLLQTKADKLCLSDLVVVDSGQSVSKGCKIQRIHISVHICGNQIDNSMPYNDIHKLAFTSFRSISFHSRFRTIGLNSLIQFPKLFNWWLP